METLVYWSISIIRENPNKLFVFSDNDQGKGTGVNMIMRNEPNTIGIPIKKYPSHDENSYWTDDGYLRNMEKIDLAIENLLKRSSNYDVVVFPENFGAKLAVRAPRTYEYLCSRLNRVKNELAAIDRTSS